MSSNLHDHLVVRKSIKCEQFQGIKLNFQGNLVPADALLLADAMAAHGDAVEIVAANSKFNLEFLSEF